MREPTNGERILHDVSMSVWRQLAGLSKTEREEVFAAAEALSTTNCWHFTYAMRTAFLASPIAPKEAPHD